MSEPTLSAGPAAGADQNSGQQQTDTSQQTSGSGGQQEQSNGFNPAWNSLLGKIPQGLHKLIEPDLRQWDENFRNKTQEVQSRYEPYQFLIDNEVAPDQVEAALQIMSLIEADPRAFHTQMGEFYKDQWGDQGQQEVSQGGNEPQFSLDSEEFDITQHPKFQELLQNQDAMAQFLAQQIEQQQTDEAEAELEQEETRLKEQYGEFNEEAVYSYALQNDVDLEEAVKWYVNLQNQIRSAPRANDSAPNVFTPSGGVPSSQPNPGSLSDKQTRELVADFLRRSHQG